MGNFADGGKYSQQEHSKFADTGNFADTAKYSQQDIAKFAEVGKFPDAAKYSQQDHAKFAEVGKFADTGNFADAGKYSQQEHSKFADAAAKYSQPDHAKFTDTSKYSQQEHAKFADAAKYSQQEHAKFADASKYSQPEHAKFTDASKYSQPDHAKFADASKYSQPEHAKFADASKYSQPDHAKFADAAKGARKFHMERTFQKSGLPVIPPDGPGWPPKPAHDFQPGSYPGFVPAEFNQHPEAKSPSVLDSSDEDKKLLSPPAPPKSSLKSYRHNFTHSLSKEPEPAKLDVEPAKPPRSQTNYVPNLTARNPANKKVRAPKPANKNAPMNYQSFGSDGTEPKPGRTDSNPGGSTQADPSAPYQHPPHYPQHLGATGYAGYNFGNSYYEGQYPPYQSVPAPVPPPQGGYQLPPEKMTESHEKPQTGSLPQYGLADKNLHLPEIEEGKTARKEGEGKREAKTAGKESPESNRSTPSSVNPPPEAGMQYSTPYPPPYPPAGGALPPYDMMMNSYPPHQYNAAPGPYRPPNPYPAGGYPMGYGGGNNYDADYARASMYSAFHRPEPHHFPPSDLPSPFLAPHHRFPTPSPPQNPNYYPQNMYAPPYGARPAYGATDPAYNPYGSTAGFNPFLNPHLAPPIHQGYPGIAPATPTQNTQAPPPQ